MITSGVPFHIVKIELEYVATAAIAQYESAVFPLPLKVGTISKLIKLNAIKLITGFKAFEELSEWNPGTANVLGASVCIAGGVSKDGSLPGFDPYFLEPLVEITRTGGLETSHFVTGNYTFFLRGGGK